MQVRYHADDRPYVAEYEPGDLVRLRIDEAGENAMGKAGHWGAVIAVHGHPAARLDMQLAGFSERRNATLQRLVGIPRSIVIPCDRNGAPVPLPPRQGLRKSHQGAERQHRPVQRAGMPAWAASIALGSAALLLAAAAALAARSFGLS
ncbi:hypothetical protein J8J14_19615 [Roseomonas sp. SSH11]|uniref:DUF2283 domain-containing protein n=1 Tax=Pararoseomonas baculiformis TaxID=2820812 RepID=A0ABS4AJF8_9PROT|nr:hypothetical protein [Pararoseomonas baculiformis]MBP0446989.1 hypothetical protein [Pararoseomonas baculiformis]